MKKIYFTKSFVFGLHTFFGQVELSIHRALNDSWDRLLLFYKDKLPPERILEYLKNHCKKETISFDKTIEEPIFLTIPQKILSVFNRIVGGKPYLYDVEVLYYYLAIKRFLKIIGSNDRPNNDQIVVLRMDLNHYGAMLSLRLSNNEISRSQLVEHFNQSYYKKFLSLEKIVGNNWLDT